MENEIFEETPTNIKKQSRSFLSDAELQNKIDELSIKREGISLEITKLRNRLNARVFKAKKKAGVHSASQNSRDESLASDVTS